MTTSTNADSNYISNTDQIQRIDQEEQYRKMLMETEFPPEVDRVLDVACHYYRAQHRAYVDYLSGYRKTTRAQRENLGTPGRETRSPGWRLAEAAAFASLETLATLLGVLYPSPTGHPPMDEARAVVTQRVGPLCTGWRRTPHSPLTHHPHDNCTVHPHEDEL